MTGICILLLIGFGLDNVAIAAQRPLSGSFVSSYIDDSFGKNVGNGTYTVSYNFPSVLSLGSNLTGQVSLQVNQLNGLQVYVEEYQITVEVAVPNGQGTTAVVGGSAPLYPGAIWGPENVTIPITQQAIGSVSGSVNASVSIVLATTVLVQILGNAPGGLERVHSDSQLVGNITINAIQNPGNAGRGLGFGSGVGFLPYLIVVAGVIIVSAGIFLPRLFPEKRRQSK